MFQFPALAYRLAVWSLLTGLPHSDIYGSRAICAYGLFAPLRNFSQLITSFVASESLGILHAPFLTFFRPTIIADRLSFWVDMGLLRARVLFFPTCQGSF